MPQRVKGKKMDAHLVSNQNWELQYIAKKFDATVSFVRLVKNKVGRSRKIVYKFLRNTAPKVKTREYSLK